MTAKSKRDVSGQRTISKPGRDWPADATLPDDVTLPVCPVCGHIGKNPGTSYTRYACVGPIDGKHKRTRMIEVTFRPHPRLSPRA